MRSRRITSIRLRIEAARAPRATAYFSPSLEPSRLTSHWKLPAALWKSTVRYSAARARGHAGLRCGGTPTDLGANISDDGTCAFSVSPSMNNTNPLLEPLANNGGPTDTFALEISPSASPAFGLVSLANCTDQQLPTPQPPMAIRTATWVRLAMRTR